LYFCANFSLIRAMPKYFENIASIDDFTLNRHTPIDIPCIHCLKVNQLKSHGFIFKQRSSDVAEKIGKRIICSNRYGGKGCGQTMALYVKQEFPGFCYNSAHVFVFLATLLVGASVQKAYQKATGTDDPSNAWRWLNKLERRFTEYRHFLKHPAAEVDAQFTPRVARLQILLPIIKRLFFSLGATPCADYQMRTQLNFI